jgi:hypothetical protein
MWDNTFLDIKQLDRFLFRDCQHCQWQGTMERGTNLPNLHRHLHDDLSFFEQRSDIVPIIVKVARSPILFCGWIARN